jgi:hypothetical protein
LILHPKQKPRRGGGLRQINTCLYRSIFKKRGHLGFGVFLDISSMLTIEHSGGAQLVVHQLDVRRPEFYSWLGTPGRFFQLSDWNTVVSMQR